MLRARRRPLTSPRPRAADPTVLHRFLIAGRQSAPKAAALIEAMLAWREAKGVEETAATFDFSERAAFLKAYPQGWHKCDRAGRPVFIQQLGRADVDATLAVTTEEVRAGCSYRRLRGAAAAATAVVAAAPCAARTSSTCEWQCARFAPRSTPHTPFNRSAW